MITELTPEQERLLENTIQYWLKVGRSCERLNREKVSTIIGKLYEAAGKRKPQVLFFPSPLGRFDVERQKILSVNLSEIVLWDELYCQLSYELMIQLSNRLQTLQDMLWNELGVHLSTWTDFNIWCMSSLMALYNFCRQIGAQYTNKENCLLDLLLEATKECFWWSVHEDVVFICERPTNLELDRRGRLHSTNDMAMKFEDGCGFYAVHGVRVDERVIRREYTISDIENEPNVEVRRVMMDLYGQSRYLQESNAETVHKDDWGVLYRKVMSDDEHLMMVKVVNSTPEPDGSFKDYFIRVNPNAYGGLKTARAAVASTWRNKDGSLAFERPEDYYPIFET